MYARANIPLNVHQCSPPSMIINVRRLSALLYRMEALFIYLYHGGSYSERVLQPLYCDAIWSWRTCDAPLRSIASRTTEDAQRVQTVPPRAIMKSQIRTAPYLRDSFLEPSFKCFLPENPSLLFSFCSCPSLGVRAQDEKEAALCIWAF